MEEEDEVKIPGFGFDESPPKLSTSGNTSLFGLISKVNKGIIKQPPRSILKKYTPPMPDQMTLDETSPALLQARAVAEKLSSVTQFSVLQRKKHDAFHAAKCKIQEIQTGVFTLAPPEPKKAPMSKKALDNMSRPGLGFVSENTAQSPHYTPTPKHQLQQQQDKPYKTQPLISSSGSVYQPNKTQTSSTYSPAADSFYAFKHPPPVTSKPATVTNTNSPLVAYGDEADNDTPGTHKQDKTTVARQNALDEIDKYRVLPRSSKPSYQQSYQNKSTQQSKSSNDNKGKKKEPFKNDFDRYFYGNASQKNEISTKMTDKVDQPEPTSSGYSNRDDNDKHNTDTDFTGDYDAYLKDMNRRKRFDDEASNDSPKDPYDEYSTVKDRESSPTFTHEYSPSRYGYSESRQSSDTQAKKDTSRYDAYKTSRDKYSPEKEKSSMFDSSNSFDYGHTSSSQKDKSKLDSRASDYRDKKWEKDGNSRGRDENTRSYNERDHYIGRDSASSRERNRDSNESDKDTKSDSYDFGRYSGTVVQDNSSKERENKELRDDYHSDTRSSRSNSRELSHERRQVGHHETSHDSRETARDDRYNNRGNEGRGHGDIDNVIRDEEDFIRAGRDAAAAAQGGLNQQQPVLLDSIPVQVPYMGNVIQQVPVQPLYMIPYEQAMQPILIDNHNINTAGLDDSNNDRHTTDMYNDRDIRRDFDREKLRDESGRLRDSRGDIRERGINEWGGFEERDRDRLRERSGERGRDELRDRGRERETDDLRERGKDEFRNMGRDDLPESRRYDSRESGRGSGKDDLRDRSREDDDYFRDESDFYRGDEKSGSARSGEQLVRGINFYDRHNRDVDRVGERSASPESEPKVEAKFHCKDCNVSCLNQEMYDGHMKSDDHILTLQKKAQELFQMPEKRASRFNFDDGGRPLVAKVLPAPMVGMPGTNRPRLPGTETSHRADRDKFINNPASGIQVIPPKPLGPLDIHSIGCTSVDLKWKLLSDIEEDMMDRFVMEYRNARETHWVTVGTTRQHAYMVDGLQEGTDYLFRLYSMNGVEKSECLESVLVTTKKRKERPSSSRRDRRTERSRSNERSRKRSRSRSRDRSRRQDRPRNRERERSRDRDTKRNDAKKKVSPASKKATSPQKKKIEANKMNSKDSRKTSRQLNRAVNEVFKEKKREQEAKKNQSVQWVNESEEKVVKDAEIYEDADIKVDVADAVSENTDTVVDTTDKTDITDDEVECHLYTLLDTCGDNPILGLDDVTEIQSFKPNAPVRYICRMCNTKGSDTTLINHIIGTPHKMAFFKQYNMYVYDCVTMLPSRKDKTVRLDYEGRLVEEKHGRGAVKVLQMLNPADHDNKIKFKDPVSVKAPPPVRQHKTVMPTSVPEPRVVESQFDAVFAEQVEKGLVQDPALIGLSLVKEIYHPKMEEPPKYICTICNAVLGQSTIVYHLVGKKHRMTYFKLKYPEIYEELSNMRAPKQHILTYAAEVEEKEGRGTMVTTVSRKEALWKRDMSKKRGKNEEIEVNITIEDYKGGPNEDNQTGYKETESQMSDVNQSSKDRKLQFGIKKSEHQSTNIQQTNVLESVLEPSKKEKFDWQKENASLQAKIQNQTVIKCTRTSKFITVYADFFKRFPVVGLGWLTEFQKPDPKQEPWYMCFMCKQKLQWKVVLDHTLSVEHRLNYIKKQNLRHKQVPQNTAEIEPLCKLLLAKEGVPTHMEVMLELNINKEALKSVMKVKEHVKATTTATATLNTLGQGAPITVTSTIHGVSAVSMATQNTLPATQSTMSTSQGTVLQQHQTPGTFQQTSQFSSATKQQTSFQNLVPKHPPPLQMHPFSSQNQMQPRFGMATQSLPNVHVSLSSGSMPGMSQPNTYPTGINTNTLGQGQVQSQGQQLRPAFPAQMNTNTIGVQQYQPQGPPLRPVLPGQQLPMATMPQQMMQSQPPMVAGQPGQMPFSQNNHVSGPGPFNRPNLYQPRGPMPFTQNNPTFASAIRQPVPPMVANQSLVTMQPAMSSLPGTNLPPWHQGQPANRMRFPNTNLNQRPPFSQMPPQHIPRATIPPQVSVQPQAITTFGNQPRGSTPQGTFSQPQNITQIIEKQAEKVLTKEILTTGQFPAPGTNIKVNLNETDENQEGATGDSSKDMQQNKFEMNKGDKRSNTFYKETNFGDNKRSRMGERDRSEQFGGNRNDMRGRNSARTDTFDNRRGHSNSPNFDNRNPRQVSPSREFQHSGRQNRDFDDEMGRRDRYNRSPAYTDDHLDDVSDDNESPTEFDRPLSPGHLESLVQRYTHRDKNQGKDDLRHERSQNRSQERERYEWNRRDDFDPDFDRMDEDCNRRGEGAHGHDRHYRDTDRESFDFQRERGREISKGREDNFDSRNKGYKDDRRTDRDEWDDYRDERDVDRHRSDYDRDRHEDLDRHDKNYSPRNDKFDRRHWDEGEGQRVNRYHEGQGQQQSDRREYEGEDYNRGQTERRFDRREDDLRGERSSDRFRDDERSRSYRDHGDRGRSKGEEDRYDDASREEIDRLMKHAVSVTQRMSGDRQYQRGSSRERHENRGPPSGGQHDNRGHPSGGQHGDRPRGSGHPRGQRGMGSSRGQGRLSRDR